jgi:hypothetical protein
MGACDAQLGRLATCSIGGVRGPVTSCMQALARVYIAFEHHANPPLLL